MALYSCTNVMTYHGEGIFVLECVVYFGPVFEEAPYLSIREGGDNPV